MDVLTVLLIVLGLLIVAFAAFATVQRKRRAGGVIAAKRQRPAWSQRGGRSRPGR